MTNGSVAQRRTPTTPKTTRHERGLVLYRARGEEIRHVRGTVWVVPSCRGEGVYLVDVASGCCTCPDTPPEGESCKHVYAAIVARAKTAGCAGCGVRVRRGELVEVEESHDSLTFFEGDQVCEECAIGHGVI